MKKRTIIVTAHSLANANAFKDIEPDDSMLIITKRGSAIPIELASALSGKTFLIKTVPNPEDEMHIAFALGELATTIDRNETEVVFAPETPKKIVNFWQKMTEDIKPVNKTKTVRKSKKDTGLNKDIKAYDKPVEKDEPAETRKEEPVETRKEEPVETRKEEPVETRKEEPVEKKEPVNPPADTKTVETDKIKYDESFRIKDAGLVAANVISATNLNQRYTNGVSKTLETVKDISTLKRLLQINLSPESATSEEIDKIYDAIMNAINK